MTPRQEMGAVAALIAAAGVVLLVREPALGLAVLAGAGAATLLQPRGRTALAALVALLGGGVLALGATRPDAWLAVAGTVVAVAAGVAAVRARGWPAARRKPGEDPAGEPTARDTWDALDRGEDPTA